MKNVYKLLGIAVLAMAVVFSFAACDNSTSSGGDSGSSGGGYTLKVVNNHASAITDVRVAWQPTGDEHVYLNETGLSIAASGGTQTFSLNETSGAELGTTVFLKVSGGSSWIQKATMFNPGKTTTVTLNADGTASATQS